MPMPWIDRARVYAALGAAAFALTGCTSPRVLQDDSQPKMTELYDAYSGGGRASTSARALASRRPLETPCTTLLDAPPEAEQLAHLYPRLPNPDLFMYVRPHAVGASGAPIPAYYTRFSMYERQPYALPGEAVTPAPKAVSYCTPRGDAPAEHDARAALEGDRERRARRTTSKHSARASR